MKTKTKSYAFYLSTLLLSFIINLSYGQIDSLSVTPGKDTSTELSVYEASYKIATELGDIRKMVVIGTYIGKEYILQGRTKEGIVIVKQAYMNALEKGYLEEQLNAADILAKGFAKAGDYRKAYLLAEETKLLRDSLASARKDELSTRLQAELEARKKDAEIALSDKDKEMQMAVAEKEDRLKNVFIVVAALVVILVLVLFMHLQFKGKSGKQIAEKNILLIKERERAEEGEKFRKQIMSQSAAVNSGYDAQTLDTEAESLPENTIISQSVSEDAKNSNLFLDIIPAELKSVEDALKKNDWQKIKNIVHLMQPQLIDSGMNELQPLFRDFDQMDGRTPYLKWHQSTKDFIGKVKAKVSEVELSEKQS